MGNGEALEKLIEMGTEVNIQDITEKIAFHVAAAEGREVAMKILLEQAQQ